MPGTPFYRWGQASPNTQQGVWQLGLCPARSPPLRLCLLWSQHRLESHKSQRSEDKAHLTLTLLRTQTAARRLPCAVGNFSQKQNTGQEEPPGSLSASIVLPHGPMAAVRWDACLHIACKGKSRTTGAPTHASCCTYGCPRRVNP